MINIRKGKADGRIYDIIELEEYPNVNKELYDNIAVEWNGCIYPKRSQNDDKPGLYSNGCIGYLVHPSEENIDEYKSESNIIDFNSDNIKELMEKSNKLRDMEREILTNPDDIFRPTVGKYDDPEMVALKKAVTAKNIDIYKYAPRFGANFQNDRRLFQDKSITMYKLKRFLNNLDMKGTLIIEDSSPDVPNPMNCAIKVELNGESD